MGYDFSMKILLVEDNAQLNKALSALLKRNSLIVDSAVDGEEALSFIEGYEYDVIVLDVMMPKIDGFEVLRRMRAKGDSTPVIMLTAKSTTEDKIKGLDLGADDYLAKPFSADELLARIRALSRRRPNLRESTLKYGDLELNPDTCKLTCGSESVVLMNKEMQILTLLMEKQGKYRFSRRHCKIRLGRGCIFDQRERLGFCFLSAEEARIHRLVRQD